MHHLSSIIYNLPSDNIQLTAVNPGLISLEYLLSLRMCRNLVVLFHSTIKFTRMKKVIVPVVAALLFATVGQAQMATKQTAATKPVTASTKTTVHKPVSTATSVSPTTTSSKPSATTKSSSATAIKRKHHHHKAQKAVQKKSN